MEILAMVPVSVWGFWGLCVLVMGLYRAHLQGRISKAVYVLGAPFLLLGTTVDCIMNITLATVLFIDRPRELLVTTRLKRYVSIGRGWRCDMAKSICDKLLDVFDPSGEHC